MTQTRDKNALTLLPEQSFGVFAGNRQRPIHRWYPFVEGYSADLVEWGLAVSGRDKPRILDPFGGSGTTALTAAEQGLDSWFCEVNPYLAWLADVKVNQTGYVTQAAQLAPLVQLRELAQSDCLPSHPTHEAPLLGTESKRAYFPEGVAQQVIATLEWLDSRTEGAVREIGRAAVVVSLVPSSNMIRRTDLRRRIASDPPPKLFADALAETLRMVVEDLRPDRPQRTATAAQLAEDVRSLSVPGDLQFDLVITSPPYLNGTNYCRNTKLELLALGIIADEAGLSKYRTDSITAGINNVSKRRATPDAIDSVEVVAEQLDEKAYDVRIPALVRGYFSDMRRALKVVRDAAADDATLLLDIGDSRFAGVHVPTHELLVTVGEQVGWHHIETIPVRERRSYDGSALVQVVLRMSAHE